MATVKRVMAGEVLTVSLLRLVDKAAYQFGGFILEGNRGFRIENGKPVFTLPTAVIDGRYIKGSKDKFIARFDATMNAFAYNIRIV